MILRTVLYCNIVIFFCSVPSFAEIVNKTLITSSATTPAQKNMVLSQGTQKVATSLPAFLLQYYPDLISKDYRKIAAQLFQRAVQDYEQWLKLGRPVDFHNALFHINSAVEITPDAPEYLFFQGMLYASLKADPLSLAQATDSFLSVLELQPDHRQARFALAQALQEQGKFQLAAEQYQLLLDTDPQMVTGLVLAPLAFCYLSGENPEAGLNYLKKLSLRYPGSASLRTTIAVLLQNSNRSGEAGKELQQVIHEKLGSKTEQDYARLLQARWLKGEKQ